MNIILMGYRGCGKTSIGKKLAGKTWKTFVDVDDEIRERFEGKSVKTIWEEHGEPEYRQVEGEVVQQLMQQDDQVIGLGGGTLTVAAAKQAILDAQDVVRVYLACKPEVLAERINADPTSAAERPSLTGSSGGGALEEIKAVLAKREPVYREVADVVFDVTYVDVAGAVNYLVSKYL